MENDFGYLVAGSLALFVIALLLLGKYFPGTGADVLDWKPTRSLETEVELELDDVDQMLAAQNERRRRRGAQELSLEEVELGLARDLREQHARRDAYRASLEGSEEASRDLDDLLAVTNQRRVSRGQAPVTTEQFKAELARDRQRLSESGGQSGGAGSEPVADPGAESESRPRDEPAGGDPGPPRDRPAS
jgi:hypothetical protein